MVQQWSAVTLIPMRLLVVVVLVLCAPFVPSAHAQASDSPSSNQSASSEAAWSLRAAAAAYFFDDDDDYVQPTLTADRGALHLESRYNYEGRESLSAFIGWNLEYGKTVTVALTPMFGGVVGGTDGIVPGVELTLDFRRVELYAEGEYVIDLNESSDSFLYSWSELSVSLTDWLRGGVVTQRTRVRREPREIERGILAGVTLGPIEGTVYFFNPGSDDHYIVASIGVSF